MSLKFVSWLLGLMALIVVGNPLSVRAETPSTDSASRETELSDAWVTTFEPAKTDVSAVEPVAINSTSANRETELADTRVTNLEPNLPLALAPAAEVNLRPANVVKGDRDRADSQTIQPQPASNLENATKVATPTPGSLQTSAASLQGKLQTSSRPAVSSPSDQANTTVAQITPGRPTRGIYSYIGVGGNIGLNGNTALGSGAFAINSKIGLTQNISARPAVLLGDNTSFTIPVTYDFVIQTADPFQPVAFAPFAGGGIVLSTQDNNNIGFLLTGGVDIPLSREFVANATLNVGFMDKTEVGLMLGVGYTFTGF